MSRQAGGRAQFFSGCIFGTRSDMSRMGDPTAGARGRLGYGKLRGGRGAAEVEGDCCECEMHPKRSAFARSRGIDSQLVTLC